jgi:anti-anti-sigma factor
MLDIRVEAAAGKPEVNIVKLTGRLDTLTYEAAQANIAAVLDRAPSGVILDMAEMDFISSAGLRVMIILWKKAAAEGKKIAMAAVDPSIYKIFKIAGMDRQFDFFDNQDDAINAM